MLNSTMLMIGALVAVLATALSALMWRQSAAPATLTLTTTRGLATVELFAVLVMAPALMFPSPTRLFGLALIPWLWWRAKRAGQPLVPASPLNIALWLLLALVGMSTGVTFDILFSLGKIAGVILGVLLYWAMVRWIDGPDRLRAALGALVGAASALALIGLFGVEKAGPKWPFLSDVVARLPVLIRGVPGAETGFSPNPIGGCLALFVPLQIALLGHRGLRSWMIGDRAPATGRLLVGAQVLALMLTVGTTILMQSRGAWLGLVVSAGLAAWWRWRRLRQVTTAVAAGTVAVCVVGAILMGPSRLMAEITARVGPYTQGDVQLRVALWTSGVRGIADAPWTGFGMNAFRRVMMERYPIPEITAHYVEVAHAHNNVLQAALDLGLAGAVVYLAIWLTVGRIVVVTLRRVPGSALAVASGALGLGLVAHFIFGITDAIPLGAKLGVLFWMTLAVVVATLNATTDGPTAPPA